MGVEVDEAGRDDAAPGVDHLVGNAVGPATDLGDAAVFDPEVTPELRHPCAVDNRAVLDVDVVIGSHHSPSSDG